MVVFEVKKEEQEEYKGKIPFRFKEQLSPFFEYFLFLSGSEGSRKINFKIWTRFLRELMTTESKLRIIQICHPVLGVMVHL